MNPGGPAEEAAGVAKSILESLKSEPLVIGSMLINFALIALLWMAGDKMAATREREVNLLYESQKFIAETLSRCIVPK